MNTKRVDRLDEIDVAALTLADIAHELSTGVSIAQGAGRRKDYSYRSGVITPIGDIEDSLWQSLAEQLIDRCGERWLLKALVDWRKERNHWKLSAAELHREALESHSHRLFDSEKWVDYIPFNRKYRPELLSGRSFPKIRSRCRCGAVGEVTEHWLTRDTAPCPGCGAFYEYDIVEQV